MKKRLFICCFIFILSILHLLIPNVVFGQVLAKQVFDEYEELLLRNDIRTLLPDVLVGLKNPQFDLDYNGIGFIVKSPNLLKSYIPNIDTRFIDLLKVDDNLKDFLVDDPVRNLILDPEEIDELVKLINQAPTTPTSLEKVASTDNQHGSPNANLQPFRVIVKDLNDKPLDGILVAFSVTPVGHGKISSPERVRTNNRGEAQATLTLGSDPGIYQVEATVVDFPSLTQTFTAAATGVSGEQDEDPKPTTLAIVSGNGQWGEPGKALDELFVVVVRDQYGDPFVGDVSVTFSVTVGDGEISSPERVRTNNMGEAQATLTLGSDPGIYQVEATVVDFPSLTQTFIVATSGQSDIAPEEVTISEIMFVSNKRALPQWIELNNSSNTDVDLEGWTLEIHGIFGLPVAGKVKIEDTAGGTLEIITTLNFQNQHRQYVQFIFPKRFIKPQETLLIASSFSRKFKSSLPEKRVHVLEIHKLLGEAFYLKLSNKTGELVDEVGNFNILTNRTDWSLPNSVTEDRYRASMIRRHDFGVPRPGTEQRAWISAIKTDLVNSSTTYYGDDSDIGAPGIKNGGAVPVQLSSFRAERIDAGVAITWSTESELDNAGFTIRRSKTQNDVFRSIHARLILGAGTTSEKNDYTFIDTTAEPGVIYYYQIEDISFGGVRQTLATTRLRGDFSAKGKSTTTWGSLKGQY